MDTTEELRMTRREWEDLRDLEALDRLENSKLIRAFGGWLDEQVDTIRDQIWENPEWERAIMERRYEALPKLMLAPASGNVN